MFRSRKIFHISVAVVSLTFGSWAIAVPLPYQFTGVITTVASELSSRFTVGDPVLGFVSVETTPFIDLPGQRWYPASNLIVSFGNNYTATSSGAQLQVYDNFGGITGIESVLFDSTSQMGLMAPTVNGHTPDYFTLNIAYPNTSILSSTNLLPQFPLSGQGSSSLRFDVNASLLVRYRVTNFSVVPEPSAVIGCGVALSLTLLPRRRRSP